MKRSAMYLAAIVAAAPISAGVTLWASDPSSARSLDFSTRWESVQSVNKHDRLTLQASAPSSAPAVSFSDQTAQMTIVLKAEASTAKQTPSQARDVAPVEAKQKPLFACEPSFSPVTMPAFAHLTGRCLAALQDNTKPV